MAPLPAVGASLLALVEDDDAFRCMEAMRIAHEPEVLVCLARHYSYIGAADSAIATLKRAEKSGFVCAPCTLRSDAWLSAARDRPEFTSVISEAENLANQARSML